ncbi:MAG: protein kinase [Caldisericia bacterium]
MFNSRFRIIRKLGEGGMGEVYLAHDTTTETDVALKIASLESATARDRFLREIEILSSISHENIVDYIDNGVSGNNLWYAMEYIPGLQLIHWFKGQSNISFKNLAKVFSKIASALSTLHTNGIIHRDIKPDNILVCNGQPIIVDFGVAHLIDMSGRAKLTRAGAVVGTIQYMSPEQVTGSHIDGRSDLHSLGVILYEVLTGQHPYEANTLPRMISKILQERPVKPSSLNPKIPENLEMVILKLLEKNPDLRYKSADELETALLRYCSGEVLTEAVNLSPLKSAASKDIPFVGREKELNQLLLLLHSAIAGRGQVVEIFGEDGFGKSRLIQEFRAQALGHLSKFLQCSPQPEGSARLAISTILDQLADYEISCDKRIFEKHPHMIRSLSAKFADSVGIEENPPSIGDSKEIPNIVSEIMLNAFPEIPSIFVFENGIDELTFEIASEIARKIADKKIVVCFASEKELSTKLTERKELSNQANFSKLTLNPLQKTEIDALSRAILGRDLSEPEMEKIFASSNGMPNVAIQLLSNMREDSKTISLTSLPEDINSIYLEKISKLDKQTKSLIEVMSLLRKPIPIGLLSPISSLEKKQFELSFETLDSIGFIKEKNFGRELVVELATPELKDMICKDLQKNKIKEYHNRIASTLDIYYSDTKDQDIKKRIAEHYVEAEEFDKSSELYLSVHNYYNSHGNTKNAIDTIKEVEKNFEKITKKSLIVNSIFHFINTFPQTNQMELFEKYKLIGLQLLNNSILPDYTVFIYYTSIGGAYLRQRLLLESRKYLEKARLLYDKVDDTQKLEFNIHEINQAIFEENHEKLRELLEERKKLLESTNASEIDWIPYYNSEAIYFSEIGSHANAVENFKRSLSIAQKYNHKRQELRALTNLGTACANADLNFKAIDYYKQALKLSKDLTLENIHALILNDMANIYLNEGKTSEHKNILLEFKRLYEDKEISKALIDWIYKYSHLKALENDFNEAESILAKMKNRVIESNRSFWLREILYYEALCAFDKRNLRRAKLLFLQLLDLFKIDKLEDTITQLFISNIHLTHIHIDSGELDEAEEYYQKAYSLCRNYKQDVLENHLYLAEAHIEFAKSIKKGSFGFKEFFDESAWRTSYNILMQLSKKCEHKKYTMAILPTNVTELFAKLVILRIKNDKKLRAIEKRQIFEQAVNQIELLLKKYSEHSFSYKRDEIIELNNELIMLLE